MRTRKAGDVPPLPPPAQAPQQQGRCPHRPAEPALHRSLPHRASACSTQRPRAGRLGHASLGLCMHPMVALLSHHQRQRARCARSPLCVAVDDGQPVAMRLDRLVKVVLGHLAQRLARSRGLGGDCCTLGGGRRCSGRTAAGQAPCAAVGELRAYGIDTTIDQSKHAECSHSGSYAPGLAPSPVEPGFLASSSRALRPRLNSAMRASSASREARTARERGVRAKPALVAARHSCLQGAGDGDFRLRSQLRVKRRGPGDQPARGSEGRGLHIGWRWRQVFLRAEMASD